jgi:hypothetical protein
MPAELANLQAGLLSWDVEFLSKKPRYTPSLAVEVVAQETFNFYDFEKPFGLKETDTNEGLRRSAGDGEDERDARRNENAGRCRVLDGWRTRAQVSV